jgi:hypothetical protein
LRDILLEEDEDEGGIDAAEVEDITGLDLTSLARGIRSSSSSSSIIIVEVAFFAVCPEEEEEAEEDEEAAELDIVVVAALG